MTVLNYVLVVLRRAAENGYSWSVSPHEALALVAEVERLRGEAERERAAVVAWLREQGSINSMLSVMTGAADDIERGEHRREEGT